MIVITTPTGLIGPPAFAFGAEENLTKTSKGRSR